MVNQFIKQIYCADCDMPIFTENPPRSLVLNVYSDVIHQTCANKPDKKGYYIAHVAWVMVKIRHCLKMMMISC